jgi:asparagine synthase (glutamine-hydrolysing)
VARATGTAHHELSLSAEAFVDDIERIVSAMDMPLADSAAVVVYQLSREIARQGIKVVLSGEGGDELFGGYPWYVEDHSLRARLSRSLRTADHRRRDYVEGKFVFDRQELAAVFDAGAVSELLEERVETLRQLGSGLEGKIAFDYRYFLPWALMPKLDRMSMAHSVEIRAPFLAHGLVDEWSSVSEGQKVKGSKTKVRIKEFCLQKGIMSRDLLQRKKAGMNLPISWWIRRHESVFRDVLESDGSPSADLFGRACVASWFGELSKLSGDGWSRPAQKIWSAFVFDLWRKSWTTDRRAA